MPVRSRLWFKARVVRFEEGSVRRCVVRTRKRLSHPVPSRSRSGGRRLERNRGAVAVGNDGITPHGFDGQRNRVSGDILGNPKSDLTDSGHLRCRLGGIDCHGLSSQIHPQPRRNGAFDAGCPDGNLFAGHRRPGMQAEIRQGCKLARASVDSQCRSLRRTIQGENGGRAFLHDGGQRAGLAGRCFHGDIERRACRKDRAEELHLVRRSRQDGSVGAVHQHARIIQAGTAAGPVGERRLGVG